MIDLVKKETEQSLISIIIPVYNVEAYIGECLQSVINQTYTGAIECILIDDRGSDSSISIAESIINNYKGNINFKIIVHEQNKGLSASRNTGIFHATGDYLFFLDSDDFITKDCIKELVSPLAYKEYDFVMGRYESSDKSSESVQKKMLSNLEYKGKEIMKSFSKGQWYMMAWNKLCKRQFLLDNNLFFYEGLIHEDGLWSFQIACKAVSMYVIEDCTYYYRVRTNSIMTSKDISHDLNYLLKVENEMCLYINSEKIEFDKWLNLFIQKWFIGAMTLCFNLPYSYKKFYTDSRKVFFKNLSITRFKYIFHSNFLRDIHWLMPSKLGYIYFSIIVIHFFITLFSILSTIPKFLPFLTFLLRIKAPYNFYHDKDALYHMTPYPKLK